MIRFTPDQISFAGKKIDKRIKTRLPAPRSSSIGPKGCFLFLHPKVKGGGVSVDKSENNGLKIHFKSFQAILENVVFYAYTSPPNLPEGGGWGVDN